MSDETFEDEVPQWSKDIIDPGVDPRLHNDEPKLLLVRTLRNKEREAAQNIIRRSEQYGTPVVSVMAPGELKGYVFVETTDVYGFVKGLRNVGYTRGVLTREEDVLDKEGNPIKTRGREYIREKRPAIVEYEDAERYITPTGGVIEIQPGDRVDIISGPFRGSVGIVKRVDTANDKITLELADSKVPIPITVGADTVRPASA